MIRYFSALIEDSVSRLPFWLAVVIAVILLAALLVRLFGYVT